jgi:RNA polymerase sigma-70 factor, ECF subfamily
VTLLHEEATLSMPPLPLWLRGHADITAWMAGTGSGCAGSTLIPVRESGLPAFGQYRPGGHPWALIVLEIDGDRITGITNFLDTERLFPLFNLPRTP